jgi:hypothetical protein
LSDYYSELNSIISSGKGEEMAEAVSDKRKQILVAELSKKLMQGKDLCDLTSEEFTELLANDEAQSILKQAQDETNEYTCTRRKDWNFDADFGNSGFFPSWFRSIFGGKDEKNKLYTVEAKGKYNAATNVCTVTVKRYNCAKVRVVNQSTCKRWDTKNPDVETETHQLPEWNSRGSNFIREDCGGKKVVITVK